ncbi:Transcriptional adapter ada2 [Tilletia horrida]|uniref:Transcriptional adapter ada2 n=1 Tax=Tilletia horrida TaxID=155126 RepID=A0AAN6GM71_9BASI|nr:Transcriptional adapter ada2 [Tilletia horrida]KAK0561413.1 Transcriptional adapter ada2 [Tilletia horrida]
MTVSHRKHKQVTKPVEDTTSSNAPAPATAVPGVQWHCDGCGSDITLTVRIRCAGECQNFDLCGSCFCSGTETARHKAWHDYRVIEQHSYPIFSADWGADEELLLIDGCQTYGLGNWADIADHIGNRTKEEVERHYLDVYIYGKDGTEAGEQRAQAIIAEAQEKGVPAPPAGPNMDYIPDITPDQFRQRKRRRIEKLRDSQAAYVPPKLSKPLVSQPTHHSEIAGFMPGRLEFEYEYEHEAENLIKDLEFGRVYKYGGDLIPGDKDVAEAATAAIAASISGAAASDARTQRTGQVVSMRGAAPSANKNDASSAPAGDGDVSMDVAEGDSQAASSLPASQATSAARAGDASQSVPNGVSIPAPTPTTAAGTAAADTTETDNAAGASAAAAAGGEPPVDDKTPDWDEDEADVELKLTILQMYNERLDRRARKKDFIFERNLVDYKKNTTAERRRTKEEREILLRVKHFAQMQTPMDFEDFINGLAHEEALRKLTLQLQHYRSVGITSLADAAEYDRERAERTKRAAAMAENGIAAFPAAGVFGTFPTSGSRGLITAANRQQRHREQSTASFTDDPPAVALTPAPAVAAAPVKDKLSSAATGAAAVAGHTGPNGRRNSASSGDKVGRKPPKPLDLSDAPSLNLLSEAEKELCSILRIKPEPYLVIKKTILVEHIRRKGHLSRRECRQLLQIDVNKVGKIWDLLHEQGFLEAAQKAGLGAKGVGALPPPGTAASLNKPGQGYTGIPKALANGTLPTRLNGSAPLRNQLNGGTPQLARSNAVNGNGAEAGRMKRGQIGSTASAGSPSPFAPGPNGNVGNANSNGLAGSPPAYLGSPTKGATPIQHASPYRPTAAV